MKKRVGGVEQFEFDVLTEGSQMTLTIAISGWVSKKGNEGQSCISICATFLYAGVCKALTAMRAFQ